MSSWPWKFPRLCLSLMTLTILRNNNQMWCWVPHYWKLSDVSLMIRQGLWVIVRKTTEAQKKKKKKSHILHITSRVPTIQMNVGVDLEPLPEIVFARFLHYKLLPLAYPF